MFFGMITRVRVYFLAVASVLLSSAFVHASPAGALSATKLPPGFPRIVPLPRGTLLAGTGRSGKTLEVDMAVKGAVPKVIHAYMAQLSKAGFKITTSHVGGSQNFFIASGRGWSVVGNVETGAKGTSARSLPGDSIVELDVYK